MKSINYIEVPASEAEDMNRGKTTWRNGRMVAIDEGNAVTLYVGHADQEQTDAEGEPRTAVVAFPIRVEKPLTKEKAINAAEMEAYGLASPMDVAALNAALSRKWRENMNDPEVSAHDEFIRWVKTELDATGLFAKSVSQVDTTLPTLSDMLAISRMVAEEPDMLTDEQSLTVKNIFPSWESFIGKKLEAGKKVQYGGGLWKARKDIDPVLEIYPPSNLTLADYERLDAASHAGTQDDPIPYEQGMSLEKGKYYAQFGVTYECIQASGPLVYDLYQVPAIAKAVEN